MKKILLSLMLLGGSMAIYAQSHPSFPGGDEALKKYVAENVKYPPIAQENGVEGIVVIGFLVNTDGNLSQFKVERFVDPDLENEALRVVKGMPAWIPAEKDGAPIESPWKVEIPFILE